MPVIRYTHNPILTNKNVPFKVNSIFNAGAVKYKGQYLLLCRVEMPVGRSSLVLARSKDGVEFKVDPQPCLKPEDHNEFREYVEWGIEDPRITRIGEKYYILYTGYSKHQPVVMLADTKDFEKFNLHGPVSEPSNKDAVLFPEKIDGYYWKIDRPSFGMSGGSMWINRSNDLLHWGGYRFLMEGTPGSWEQDKVGASTQPVKTDQGWLLLYHGVRSFGVSTLYKLGALLLDQHEPWKIIGKSTGPILSPETEYERIGDVGNVVFSTGWIIEDSGDVKIYYSGADQNICLATTTVKELLSTCESK
ncbi:MAG: glycoside hydrolase family 130 protein [Calditrichaceae bacterium]